ncbi:MAG TPA: M13 family metallopeptidase [Terriglobales bacterium]|nr:M13 family metallopeptidase [Terriglobales bacterium]
MKPTFRSCRFLFLAAVLLSCAVLFAQEPASKPHGINPASMDRSVEPGDDFFAYANGAWLKRTEIPPDRAGVSVFTPLADLANKRTQDIIQEAAKANPPAGSEARKIADLYNSYMNEEAIEAKGVAPLQPELKKIAAIKDKRELARALGENLRADVDPLNNTNFHTAHLFGLWTAPGFDDPDRYTPYLLQGGLALPDREYYLASSPHMKQVQERYKAHVAAMLKLAGFSEPERRAARIIELEHAIAEKHVSLADNQDVHKANNPWKRADFAAKAPGLDWGEFFRAAGLDKQSHFIVWQPTAFTAEAALVNSAPLETWKDWLAFHLIEEYGGTLPKAFVDERFAMFGKTLTGTPQQRPRWQRGVFVVNGVLGDAVGKIYAQRYFSPEAKAKAEAMVANIIEAFRKRIDALTWMAPATKAEAKAKLTTLYVGVGYPESWQDYSGLEIKPDDLFGNLWRSNLFEYHYHVARLGKPVDKHQWSMTPQTVNAVNLPLQNALNFPAAILMPPFFDPEGPAAMNYGAIGAVIGHEVSHSFDSEGATFDSHGRMRNWWSAEDLDHFKKATQALVQQYNQYKPFPDLAINGQQTLAENVADVAGVAASHDGYRASLGGQAAPEQDGFSGDQQFFIAFAQTWATKVRDAALRQQVLTDSHSPAEYRADTVRNVDAWYAALGVKPGQKLYLPPAERVQVW